MASPFDIAWAVLKQIDFSDVGPMPASNQFHPDSRYAPLDARQQSMYDQHPEGIQDMMEETYIPDLQQMLELEALRQASSGPTGIHGEAGGQQVPIGLLREAERKQREQAQELGHPVREPRYFYRVQGPQKNR